VLIRTEVTTREIFVLQRENEVEVIAKQYCNRQCLCLDQLCKIRDTIWLTVLGYELSLVLGVTVCNWIGQQKWRRDL